MNQSKILQPLLNSLLVVDVVVVEGTVDVVGGIVDVDVEVTEILLTRFANVGIAVDMQLSSQSQAGVRIHWMGLGLMQICGFPESAPNSAHFALTNE